MDDEPECDFDSFEGDGMPPMRSYEDVIHEMYELAKQPGFNEDDVTEIPEHVVEQFKTEFAKIRSTLGKTVPEIFAKVDTVGWEEINCALQYFYSWKWWNKIPLTFTEEMVAGALGLEADVNNGGFHQYFFNSSGDQWRHVLQILIEGGDADGEHRFRSVLSIFPNSEPSPNRRDRLLQLERIEKRDKQGMWDHFDRWSDDFYENPYPSDTVVWAAINPRMHDIVPVWME